MKLSRHVRGLRGRTDRQATVGRGRHGQQVASSDRLRAGIEGSGGGGQAEIAMSRSRDILGGTNNWRGDVHFRGILSSVGWDLLCSTHILSLKCLRLPATKK